MIDAHVDVPWPRKHLTLEMTKLRGGGLSAAVLVAFVPQTQCTPPDRAAATARAVAMLKAIAEVAKQATAAYDMQVYAAVENGHALGADLGNLRRCRDLGARYMTLVHDGHNDLADGARPRRLLWGRGVIPTEMHGGLSALGRAAVAEMNRLGLVVDVSHASRTAMMQAVECSRVPVIASHSCCRALCDHPRNLDDEQLDALRDTGGLVCITAYPRYLRRRGRITDTTVADLADHVDYAVRRVGVESIGLSSDHGGGGGISGWESSAEAPGVEAELVRRGYDRRAIELIGGGNFLRVMSRCVSIATC